VHHLTSDVGSGTLHDHTGVALRRLGVDDSRPAHFLVRPDGHIAFRGGTDLSGVRAYLGRMIIGVSE
jgi:hypothetical protein